MANEPKRRQMPEQLVINKDRLFHLIDEFRRGIKSEYGWPAPAGILISVVLCLTVTEKFQPFLFITAEQSQGVVYLLGISSLVWLFRELRANRLGTSQEKLESEILQSLKNSPDFTIIYLIKLTTDQVPRILVEWKDSWGCFFLPYVARNSWDDFSIKNLTSFQGTVASYLGVSTESVSIEHLRDYSFTSEKYSPTDLVHKQYNFDFFFFSVPKSRMIDNYTSSPFSVGGKTYYWKTIAELLSDERTVEKNGDVVRHLEKHYAALVIGTKDSFL